MHRLKSRVFDTSPFLAIGPINKGFILLYDPPNTKLLVTLCIRSSNVEIKFVSRESSSLQYCAVTLLTLLYPARLCTTVVFFNFSSINQLFVISDCFSSGSFAGNYSSLEYYDLKH